MLESRSIIGMLARNQLESTLLSDSQGWPLPWPRTVCGKICFRSVKGKLNVCYKIGRLLGSYSPSSFQIPSRLYTATFLYHSPGPNLTTHIIELELHICPGKHTLVSSFAGESGSERIQDLLRVTQYMWCWGSNLAPLNPQ